AHYRPEVRVHVGSDSNVVYADEIDQAHNLACEVAETAARDPGWPGSDQPAGCSDCTGMLGAEQTRMMPVGVVQVAVRNHDWVIRVRQHADGRLECRVGAVDNDAERVAFSHDVTPELARSAMRRLL